MAAPLPPLPFTELVDFSLELSLNSEAGERIIAAAPEFKSNCASASDMEEVFNRQVEVLRKHFRIYLESRTKRYMGWKG